MLSAPFRRSLAVVAVVAVVRAAPAAAQEPPPTPVQPDAEKSSSRGWYGWQTLVAEVPLDVAMFAGLARLRDRAGADAFAAGLAGRSLVPAVVHLAHRRPGTALASVGLHTGMTLAGFAIGFGVALALQPPCLPRDPCRNHFQDLPPGVVYGPVAGSISGTLLDVVFLAHGRKLAWTAGSRAEPARSAWALAPYATPTTAGVAASGTF